MVIVRSMWQCKACLQDSLDEEAALRESEYEDYCAVIEQNGSIEDPKIRRDTILYVRERGRDELFRFNGRARAMLREADRNADWALTYSKLVLAVTQDKPWAERQEAWDDLIYALGAKPWDLIIMHDSIRSEEELQKHQPLPECIRKSALKELQFASTKFELVNG